VPADRDVAGEGEEAPPHHQVGELVEHDVDLDPRVGRGDQRVLERLADRVALPDEGLEEDPRLRLADRVQHVPVEVLAVGVHGDLGTTHGHRLRRGPREGGRLAQPLAPVVDDRQREQGGPLHSDHRLEQPEQHAAESYLSPLHDANLRAVRGSIVVLGRVGGPV
jgi:hypothetical protein